MDTIIRISGSAISFAVSGDRWPIREPVRSASCEGEKNKWTAVLLKNCR